jgi:hypothetical protein
MSFNHTHFNPIRASRADLYDAYRDMAHRANTLATENGLLHVRVGKLEAVARAVLSKSPMVFLGEGPTAGGGFSAMFHCIYCDHRVREEDLSAHIGHHAPNCPFTLARMVLAERPIKPRVDYGIAEESE